MRGPFRVRWNDYFGFEHEGIFWAQTPKGAVRAMADEFKYQYELISVDFVVGAVLKRGNLI